MKKTLTIIGISVLAVLTALIGYGGYILYKIRKRMNSMSVSEAKKVLEKKIMEEPTTEKEDSETLAAFGYVRRHLKDKDSLAALGRLSLSMGDVKFSEWLDDLITKARKNKEG